MIIIFAGRRIDAPDTAVSHFPLERSAHVYKRILAVLREKQATVLVSSAACGADLLALSAARELGIRRHVILPFAPAHFRVKSVTDRPGEWGLLFDQIIAEVEAAGDLVLLNEASEDTAAFVHTNKVILNEAQALAHQMVPEEERATPLPVLAVIVWEGKPRGKDDLTAEFLDEARSRNILVTEITI